MQNPETDFSFEKSVLKVDFKKEIQIPIMFTLARPLFLRRVFKSLFGFPPPPPPPPPLQKRDQFRFLGNCPPTPPLS